MDSILPKAVADASAALQALLLQQAAYDKIAAVILQSLHRGGKILTCGNGGSAADALHMAEELIGRYRGNRRPLPGLCLNADATALTCIANDFGFDEVFARQVTGLGVKGDVLVCFTSSGNSTNILRALDAARTAGVTTVSLLGKDGGRAKGKADLELIVTSPDTARVQEVHTLIIHALLEAVEQEFGN